MNREKCIKQIFEAEMREDSEESMRLFSIGLVSMKLWKQIKRDAQSTLKEMQSNPSTKRSSE